MASCLHGSHRVSIISVTCFDGEYLLTRNARASSCRRRRTRANSQPGPVGHVDERWGRSFASRSKVAFTPSSQLLPSPTTDGMLFSVLVCSLSLLFLVSAARGDKKVKPPRPHPVVATSGPTCTPFNTTNYATCTSASNRTYLLHQPANYTPSKSHALVVSYHGAGGSSNQQAILSQFSDRDC